jgi:hypothetical protein
MQWPKRPNSRWPTSDANALGDKLAHGITHRELDGRVGDTHAHADTHAYVGAHADTHAYVRAHADTHADIDAHASVHGQPIP